MKNIKLRTKLLIIVLVTAIPMVVLHSYMIEFHRERAVDIEVSWFCFIPAITARAVIL